MYSFKATESLEVESVHPKVSEQPIYYKIVTDKIDFQIQPRYMRINKNIKSVHYVNCYAIKDRVNVESFPTIRPPPCTLPSNIIAKTLLPTVQDYFVIIQNLKILFAHILVETLPFLNHLSQILFSNILNTKDIRKCHSSHKL
jgi:hypothetical protein